MHLSKVISESGHSPCHSPEVLAAREPVNVATALGAAYGQQLAVSPMLHPWASIRAKEQWLLQSCQMS